MAHQPPLDDMEEEGYFNNSDAQGIGAEALNPN